MSDMLDNSYYFRECETPPKWLRRDLQSFFVRPIIIRNDPTGTAGAFDTSALFLNKAWGTILSSDIYGYNVRYWNWLQGRIPSSTVYMMMKYRAEYASDPYQRDDINDGHPFIQYLSWVGLCEAFVKLNGTRYERLALFINDSTIYNPLKQTHLTDVINATNNGSTSSTKTLNTHDNRSVIGTNTLERTGTETNTPTGTETSTSTRSGKVSETPTGSEVSTDSGIASRDFAYAFDTASGVDDPGSPVAKQGREMTHTTSFTDRKTDTTYDNLKDETTRSFTSRSDTLTRDTRDVTNNSVTDGTDHTGTVTDAGTSTDTIERTRTLDGYQNVDMPDKIRRYREVLMWELRDYIMTEFLNYISLATYSYT